jgi:dipeptidyl aminopeptidase/acylaminoacyl peptidase
MNPFSLATYHAIPRVTGLLLSPDGRRLVLPVQTLSPDGTRFVTSLWEMPADGSAPARRLTFSEKGEAQPAFLPDGSLVFASARTDPTVAKDEAQGHVWVLPAGAGEARPVLAVPGGVDALVAASGAATIAIRAPLFPDVADLESDAEKQKRRGEAGVSAVLFESHPVRHWDEDLGPRHARLLRLSGLDRADGERGRPEDLTSEVGVALHDATFALSPDGEVLVTTWQRPAGRTFQEIDLVAIGAGGTRTLSRAGDFHTPAVSPDGRRVAAITESRPSPDCPPDQTLWLFDLQGGEARDLTAELDLWPESPVWSRDGGAIFFVADERGHAPVFRIDPDSGATTKVTAEGCYTSLCPAPDGSIFALRSSRVSPPEVVRIDAGGNVTALPTPGLPLALPGVLGDVTATADDGSAVHGWLVLPADASAEKPAPLLLWIHGGPLSSWNAWTWRWCPHLMVERGYAVLLADPALSTGYGQENVRRGWRNPGPRVHADLMALLDAALRRPELDASRTAAMGGSFGGYMANWEAGHTDRFRAIVTHASLWAIDQFHATTDSTWWEGQYGDPYTDPQPYRDLSPRTSLSAIRTPMLVIHGLRDYRVPISEALRLWTDLQRHDVPSRYLYFPDENHWVLKPGNARVWYETVLAFLDHHVLGAEWRKPELL